MGVSSERVPFYFYNERENQTENGEEPQNKHNEGKFETWYNMYYCAQMGL